MVAVEGPDLPPIPLREPRGAPRCGVLLPPAGGAEENTGGRLGEQSRRRSLPESGLRLPLSRSSAARLRDAPGAESTTQNSGARPILQRRFPGPRLPGSAGA